MIEQLKTSRRLSRHSLVYKYWYSFKYNIKLGVGRRKDVESSLLQRKDIRVDPYRQGFGHLDNTANIDLNAVRLCFQVSQQLCIVGRTTFLSIGGHV